MSTPTDVSRQVFSEVEQDNGLSPYIYFKTTVLMIKADESDEKRGEEEDDDDDDDDDDDEKKKKGRPALT